MKSVRWILGALVVPASLAAQEPTALPSANPVVTAVKLMVTPLERNIQAAADTVPASLLNYKLTPAQLSFADIWNHLAAANYGLCAALAGTPAPADAPSVRAPRDTTKGKAALVATLKASFTFCQAAVAKTEDAKLGESVQIFGGSRTKALALLIYAMDLQDHYSQISNYMRANNMLPPSAQGRGGRGGE